MALSFLFVISALLIGSFLNVVITRGPVQWGLVETSESPVPNLWAPRSRCNSCKAQITALHLIPLVSFIMLRGKCAACGAKIGLRYPITEGGLGLAAIFALYIWQPGIPAALAITYIAFLLALAVIDWETGFLPDALTLPLIWIGLLANINGQFAPLSDAVIGACVGYIAFRLVGDIYIHLRGVDGLGRGDAKLLAAVGAWTGWMVLPFVVLLAAIGGLTYMAVQSFRGKEITSTSALSFGPYIAGAGVIIFIAAALNLLPV